MKPVSSDLYRRSIITPFVLIVLWKIFQSVFFNGDLWCLLFVSSKLIEQIIRITFTSELGNTNLLMFVQDFPVSLSVAIFATTTLHKISMPQARDFSNRFIHGTVGTTSGYACMRTFNSYVHHVTKAQAYLSGN